MTSKNIVLVGFMGSGKSMISKLLGKRLGRKVISTDEVIIKKAGVPINQIFKDKGEAYFRQLEKDVVTEVSKESGCIIDCGGGVIINESNIESLKKAGVLFYLEASADFLYEQIKISGKRPLLDVDDPKAKIEELLKERLSFYLKADYTVASEGQSIERVSEEIASICEKLG